MGAVAIRVSGLGKQYQIGASRKPASTLRDVLVETVASAAKALRGAGAPRPPTTIWALKDVSFEVKHGEVLGIIGRNGAGKSTLLKILSRITEPTCGEVDIYGRVGSLLEVGTGFHQELTGRENIYLNGAILGMKRKEIQSKFDQIVDFAGVETFIDTPVKHYSSGMYMRLAFAVAAHLEPEILLVDEVLAVGDAEFQKKCLGKMGQVASEGRTVFFVSHQISAIRNLCRTALLLDHGQVVSWGDTAAVIEDYTAPQMGRGPINLTLLHARQGSGAIRFQSVHLLDEHGEKVSAFRCGEPAIFGLLFENRVQTDLHNVQVSLGIDNALGERIALLSSDLTGALLTRVPADADGIEILVERLPLAPGRYGCTLYSSVNGVTADWIQNAGSFDIEPGDFFGTGRLPPAAQGTYLIDHSFRLSRRDRAA